MKNTVCRNEKTAGNTAYARNSSLDILRIVCMFLIVLGHAMVHGHVLETVSTDHANYYLVNILRTFLSIHVNCFVLISGYFLCTHKFRLSRPFSIWGQSFFWSLALYLLLCFGRVIPFDIASFAKACLPFTQQRYWFVTTYLLMYALTPLLNAAIRAMNQRQHAWFLTIFFIIYIALQNLFFWGKFTSTNSYDPLFFAFLYMIAAYFRLYPAKKTKRWYILCYCLACTFSAVWKIGVAWLTRKIFGEVMGDNLFLSYSSITMVFASACLFRFFEGLNVVDVVSRKPVRLLSSLTFGIYLIHEQPEIRTFLWSSLLRPEDYARSPALIPLLLGMALLVFSSCAVLEYFRQRISKRMSTKKLIEGVSNRITRVGITLTECVFRLEHKEDR